MKTTWRSKSIRKINTRPTRLERSFGGLFGEGRSHRAMNRPAFNLFPLKSEKYKTRVTIDQRADDGNSLHA